MSYWVTFCESYLIMLSILQTIQWGMYMIVEWWIGKDLEGSGYSQMEVLPSPKNCKVWQINHEGWGKQNNMMPHCNQIVS